MSNSPLMIAGSNLSHCWAEAFLEVMARSIAKCPPIIVSISDFDSDVPPEDVALRTDLDKVLRTTKCNSCDVSAMVIFPFKLWQSNRHLSCEEFCDKCVNRFLPRLKALNRRNHHGTYFERMMAFRGVPGAGSDADPVNQLAEVIDRLNNKKRFRATGTQISCFDPAKDHSRQPRLGFPCLQQVGVTYEDTDGIAITGFYPSQHIFARAYGNYLGLAHLGRFLCDHSGLELRRIICIATRPLLGDVTKAKLSGIRKKAEAALERDQS